MIVGYDVTVFAVDYSASGTFSNILAEPGICYDGFCGNGYHGVFVFSDDFLNGKLTACGFSQIVVCGGNCLIYDSAAEMAHRQSIGTGPHRC